MPKTRGDIPGVAFGGFLILLAIVALAETRNLSIGTAADMGPGYVPRALSFIIMAFGLVIAGRSFFAKRRPLPAIKLRPILSVLVSLAVFALLLPRGGLALATLATMACSTSFHRRIQMAGERHLRRRHHGLHRSSVRERPRACRSPSGRGGKEHLVGLFDNLALGFSTALSVQNLLFCLLRRPDRNAGRACCRASRRSNTTAMLLPFTFGLAPTSAMIMLAGIFYGAQYGGSTTAILVNVPGETSAVVTCLDGYQMARQGRAGPALAIAAIASFFAGCVATVVIALLSAPLAALALKFTAPEYFSLLVMGLIAAVVLAHGSPSKPSPWSWSAS